jgi:ribosomal protein S18 acetylase RimI-like enzyme
MMTGRFSSSTMIVRDAHQSEVYQLARLWYDGWQDAHAQIVPPELKRVRTLESFQDRLADAISTVRVVGRTGEPLGFHMLKHDELYQLYVSAYARGAGVGTLLITDAEERLREAGIEAAWLACAIGNERAARFYEKHQWLRVGVVVSQLETSAGVFPLEVWRYEKHLRGAPSDHPHPDAS